MVDRIVLGSSSLGHTIVESLIDRQGSVRVVTTDESRAKALRDRGVAVETAEPTEESTLRELEPPDIVIVVGDDTGENCDAASAARAAFPESHLIAYAGEGATGGVGRLTAVADRVIDPTAAVGEQIVDRAGDRGIKMRQLRRVLAGIDRLAILAHDNPDPDAIGSAVALARLAEAIGAETEVCYYGDITHQENRALVNLLGFDLRNLDPDEDLSEFDGIALVDHSRPGVNDQLPADTPIDVVVDHHPPRAPVEAQFVDLRSGVGATSTLLVDYLKRFGVGFEENVATGLLYGIRVDTQAFTRETAGVDFEAAAILLPHADLGTLERIESPSISPETFGTIADAIHNRQREGHIVTSCVGRLSNRDALAQAADRLLTLEDVTMTLVCGVRDGTIFVSGRSRGGDADLGEILRDAFGPIGSAGGHAGMAGAQIRVGVLENVDEQEGSLTSIVEQVVRERFLDAYDARAGVGRPQMTTGRHDDDKYVVPDVEFPDDDPEM
jgi:nanoRNase/pAp phosphatase (c-di-AMP/oligoRNAs hydrolase)